MTKKEAFIIIKELHDKSLPFERDAMEVFFPELKESEDEKIRKSLIEFLESIWHLGKDAPFEKWDKSDCSKWIAWLENQGKQKPPVIDFKANNWYVSKVDGKIYDMTYNPTDNIEPKFKVGDWIAWEELNTAKIVNIDGDRYEVEFIDGNKGFPHIDYIDRLFHLWSIQDANDGDVLVDNYGNIGIYQGDKNAETWNSCCYCGVNKGFYDGGTHEFPCYPATKEQRKMLFKKMAENGYAWDSATKELGHQEVTKKSKQGNMSKMCPRCVQEQKPQGFSIIEIINQGNAKVAADMVESKYKELTHSQVTKKSDKVKWSDEDQDFFGLLEGYLEFDYTLSMKDKANTLDWLKSIKERLQ